MKSSSLLQLLITPLEKEEERAALTSLFFEKPREAPRYEKK